MNPCTANLQNERHAYLHTGLAIWYEPTLQLAMQLTSFIIFIVDAILLRLIAIASYMYSCIIHACAHELSCVYYRYHVVAIYLAPVQLMLDDVFFRPHLNFQLISLRRMTATCMHAILDQSPVIQDVHYISYIQRKLLLLISGSYCGIQYTYICMHTIYIHACRDLHMLYQDILAAKACM